MCIHDSHGKTCMDRILDHDFEIFFRSLDAETSDSGEEDCVVEYIEGRLDVAEFIGDAIRLNSFNLYFVFDAV